MERRVEGLSRERENWNRYKDRGAEKGREEEEEGDMEGNGRCNHLLCVFQPLKTVCFPSELFPCESWDVTLKTVTWMAAALPRVLRMGWGEDACRPQGPRPMFFFTCVHLPVVILYPKLDVRSEEGLILSFWKVRTSEKASLAKSVQVHMSQGIP